MPKNYGYKGGVGSGSNRAGSSWATDYNKKQEKSYNKRHPSNNDLNWSPGGTVSIFNPNTQPFETGYRDWENKFGKSWEERWGASPSIDKNIYGGENYAYTDKDGNLYNTFTGGVYDNTSPHQSKPTAEDLAEEFLNGHGGGRGSGSYAKFGDPYDLDLSIFDEALRMMGDNYNRSRGVLNQQWADAQEEFLKSRRRGNQNFHAGRASIAENSYDRQRANINDLASRGLAGSGLQQLGDVQETMARGREVSNLANRFYEFLDEMQGRENQARNAYNSNMVSLENAYNQGVADVKQQKWNAKNNYDMAMMQRMDEMARFNAQMGAQRSAQKESLANAYNTIDAQLRTIRDIASQGGAENLYVAQDMLNNLRSNAETAYITRQIMQNNPDHITLPSYITTNLAKVEDETK